MTLLVGSFQLKVPRPPPKAKAKPLLGRSFRSRPTFSASNHVSAKVGFQHGTVRQEAVKASNGAQQGRPLLQDAEFGEEAWDFEGIFPEGCGDVVDAH